MSGRGGAIPRVIALFTNRSSFGSQVLLTAATNFVLAGLALVTGAVTARILGPEGRGELAAIQTWPGFIATFGLLGLDGALVYFAARREESAGRLYATTVVLAVLVSIPVLVLAFVFMPLLLAAQSAAVVGSAQLYLLMVLLNATIGMLPQPVRGMGAMGRWNAMRLQPSIFWLLVVLFAPLVFGPSAQVLAFGYLAAFALLIVPYVAIARPVVRPPFDVSFAWWPRLVRYGLPTVLSTVPATLNLRFDQMLMAAFFTPSILGQYAVGVAWSGALAPAVSAIAGVLLPRVSAAHATPELQAQRVAMATRLSSAITVVALVPLLLVTPVLLPMIFGSAFAPAVQPSIVLIVAAGVAGLNSVMESGANGLGHPKWPLVAEAAGLAVTVVGLALLLRPFEMMGAAVTSLASYTTTLAILVWQIRGSTGVSGRELLVPGVNELAAMKAFLRRR